MAQAESKRMKSLIEDLLVLSRAESRNSGQNSDVRLHAVVQEQIALLKLLFPEQEFLIEGDTDCIHRMNAGAWARIARNLLENACRYGEGGPITVVFQGGDEALAILFKNFGPVIDKERAERIFERFYRLDSGRARSLGGHGLGLAITRALVEEAEGKIVCSSEPGQQTEFMINFRKS